VPHCQKPISRNSSRVVRGLFRIGVLRVTTPEPANDELPGVLQARLASSPAAGIERDVIVAWSRRDPVDAAMDASVLLQRLKLDGPRVTASHDLRSHVTAVHRAWTAAHAPGVYLPAAERLLEHMNAWADAVIDEAIAADQYFPIHP
jgi:hypothetical protein